MQECDRKSLIFARIITVIPTGIQVDKEKEKNSNILSGKF